VQTITGIVVRERIPDRIVDGADELEVVDMSPQALRSRIRHGNVYPEARARQALDSYFREGNLNALRELALRRVATTVEEDLEEYMRSHEIDAAWPASERIIVGVDDDPGTQAVIRRAWRLANRLQADLIAVFVETRKWADSSPEKRMQLEGNLRYAEDLGAQIIRQRSDDVAKALTQIARDKNAAGIVVGKPARGLLGRIGGSVPTALLRNGKGLDVYVVSSSREDDAG
jgi:two-component system sensor histidine kinase KdpD